VDILRELTIQPRVILVETHGVYGAPTDLVASLLWKRATSFLNEVKRFLATTTAKNTTSKCFSESPGAVQSENQ
jgi:hypothetical protein